MKQLMARIETMESNSRYIQNALEMTLSLSDFQEDINECRNPQHILQEIEKRIQQLIHFNARAIYMVNDDDADISLYLCRPSDRKDYIEEEIRFMTDKGIFAWALREKRGIIVKSRDQKKDFLLHPISTYCQIKGLFVGLLPEEKQRIPDAARGFLSVILLNAANAIESLSTYRVMLKENSILENIIDKRTSELINYEKRLQRAQKMEAIGTLAGGVAHDLNNILSGLVSYPELLLMTTPDDSPLKAPLQTIKKSGEKAAVIVQDLLTLARRGVNTMEVVNLNHIISEYLKSPEYEKLVYYHPLIELETDFDEELSMVSGSPVHLSKTIMNLVSNAAEAIDAEGKITIKTRNQNIEHPMGFYENLKEGSYATITITDNGIGISPDDMERIFEPFYTKKAMGRSGTGLGMAVVWGTIKDHNGYIDIQTKEGEGTSFSLFLPVTNIDMPQATAEVTIGTYRGHGETILVVDDVKDQRIIASKMLTELGYRASSAESGEEAIQILKKSQPDLLILDMIMSPGINGLECYKQSLEIYPKQKAIIVSGYSETKNVRKAQELGAGQYIKKPYSLEKIGMAVKSALQQE